MRLKFQKQISLFYQTEVPVRVSTDLNKQCYEKNKKFCVFLFTERP